MIALYPICAEATTKHTVWFYGDSILGESISNLNSQLPSTSWNKVFKPYYGKTLCDFKQQIFDDLANDPDPDVIAIEIEGNDSPCMGGSEPGSPEWQAALAADMDDVAAHIPAAVNYAYAPGPTGQSDTWIARHAAVYGAINDAYVPSISTPDQSVAPGGFQEYLPCLSTEGVNKGCVNGLIRMRNLDGVHLCPSTWVQGPYGLACSAYSSGEYRFAKAWAAHVKASA